MIQTKHTGFSLVETLVAISILLIVIVGPMTIIAGAAQSTNFSSEQVTASFLAQEGLELAQKERDDLVLSAFDAGAVEGSDTAWTALIDPTGTYEYCIDVDGDGAEVCSLEIQTDSTGTVAVDDCSAGNRSNCQLYLDASTGVRSVYTHDSGAGVRTPYNRTISFEPVGTQEVKVTSRVTWRTGEQRQEQSVEAVTYVSNVYGR